MPSKQYVVLEQCYKKRRDRYYYKAVFTVDVTEENAMQLCYEFIKKQKWEFKYHIVETEYGNYMKCWKKE